MRAQHVWHVTANPLVQPTRMKPRAADQARYAAPRTFGGIRRDGGVGWKRAFAELQRAGFHIKPLLT
jgi:hypothetical protein